MDLNHFEVLFEQKIASVDGGADPAHDLAHVRRVVNTAKRLAVESGARLDVVVPAAWLHDVVLVPKNDLRRSRASALSAEAAVKYLAEIKYPSADLAAIGHAIHAHSFSANVRPETLEAEVVQDADRLDGLGAIGIARCFATAGVLKRRFYADEDPFCTTRPPDDAHFTVDHFFAKLFNTVRTLRTEAGRAEGARRADVMRRYLADLRGEIYPAVLNPPTVG